MCVILGDRVCLGLCMLFNPWGSGRETDVRAGKLSSMLMCHHILISVPAAKSVHAQGSGRVCNYVLLCTHNSAFQWACPCGLKSHFRQCPRCVCVCVGARGVSALSSSACVRACVGMTFPHSCHFTELETKAEGRSC